MTFVLTAVHFAIVCLFVCLFLIVFVCLKNDGLPGSKFLPRSPGFCLWSQSGSPTRAPDRLTRLKCRSVGSGYGVIAFLLLGYLSSPLCAFPCYVCVCTGYVSYMGRHEPDSLLVQRRTRDRKVASSNPGRSGGRIFFFRVNFLC